jgi:hypothetical protein
MGFDSIPYLPRGCIVVVEFRRRIGRQRSIHPIFGRRYFWWWRWASGGGARAAHKGRQGAQVVRAGQERHGSRERHNCKGLRAGWWFCSCVARACGRTRDAGCGDALVVQERACAAQGHKRGRAGGAGRGGSVQGGKDAMAAPAAGDAMQQGHRGRRPRLGVQAGDHTAAG